jgi:hypothetical protein
MKVRLWDHLAVCVSVCVCPPNNFWMPEQIIMKFGMHIMPPEPILTAFFIKSSHKYYQHYSLWDFWGYSSSVAYLLFVADVCLPRRCLAVCCRHGDVFTVLLSGNRRLYSFHSSSSICSERRLLALPELSVLILWRETSDVSVMLCQYLWASRYGESRGSGQTLLTVWNGRWIIDVGATWRSILLRCSNPCLWSPDGEHVEAER